jgi:hypothetical protein
MHPSSSQELASWTVTKENISIFLEMFLNIVFTQGHGFSVFKNVHSSFFYNEV